MICSRWRKRLLLPPSYSSTTFLASWLVSNSSLTRISSAYQVPSKLDRSRSSPTRAAVELLLKTASSSKTIARSIESIRKLLYRVRVFVICSRWRKRLLLPPSYSSTTFLASWLVSNSSLTRISSAYQVPSKLDRSRSSPTRAAVELLLKTASSSKTIARSIESIRKLLYRVRVFVICSRWRKRLLLPPSYSSTTFLASWLVSNSSLTRISSAYQVPSKLDRSRSSPTRAAVELLLKTASSSKTIARSIESIRKLLYRVRVFVICSRWRKRLLLPPSYSSTTFLASWLVSNSSLTRISSAYQVPSKLDRSRSSPTRAAVELLLKTASSSKTIARSIESIRKLLYRVRVFVICSRWRKRLLLPPSYSSTTFLASWLVSNSSLTRISSAYQVPSKLDRSRSSPTRAAVELLLKTASSSKTIARSIESIRKLLYRVRVFVICSRWRKRLLLPPSYSSTTFLASWLVSNSSLTRISSAYQVPSKLDRSRSSPTRAAVELLLKTASSSKTIARSIESIRKLLYRVRVFVICSRWRKRLLLPPSYSSTTFLASWLVSNSSLTRISSAYQVPSKLDRSRSFSDTSSRRTAPKDSIEQQDHCSVDRVNTKTAISGPRIRDLQPLEKTSSASSFVFKHHFPSLVTCL